MEITVLGLNHKTAPVDIRQKLALDTDGISTALRQLQQRFTQAGFVLLSTCNRTEIYTATDNAPPCTTNDLTEFLSTFCSVSSPVFQDYLYIHRNADAVSHLLSVAASLDSMVVGETQILAQVKESYALATAAQSTNKILNRLFHCAFATSKEIYSTTGIARQRVSVAGVAVKLAQQLFKNIPRAAIAVIGSGQMGELLVRHLIDLGCPNITVFNRTPARAHQMARRLGISHAPWQDFQTALPNLDIVIAAALTDDYLFDTSYFSDRRAGPLLIIDIAVPRNFDPAVNQLDDVHLYSIDDLAAVVEKNIVIRHDDLGQAHRIIADNVTSFMDWFGVMDIGPLIGQLRRKFDQITQAELDRFFAGPYDLSAAEQQKLKAATSRILSRLLHQLIHSTYTFAKTHGTEQAIDLIQNIIKYQSDDH